MKKAYYLSGAEQRQRKEKTEETDQTIQSKLFGVRLESYKTNWFNQLFCQVCGLKNQKTNPIQFINLGILMRCCNFYGIAYYALPALNYYVPALNHDLFCLTETDG